MIWDNGHPPRVGTRIFLEKLLRDIHMPSYEKKSYKRRRLECSTGFGLDTGI